MLKRLNKALPELILGILLYGVILQVTGIWLWKDRLMYTTGLWIGVFVGIGMAIHMAVVLEDAVSQQSGRAKLVVMSLLRYAAVVILFFILIRFHLGDPIAAFLGVMGLKAAAYAQPFIHKIVLKIKGSKEQFLQKK